MRLFHRRQPAPLVSHNVEIDLQVNEWADVSGWTSTGNTLVVIPNNDDGIDSAVVAIIDGDREMLAGVVLSMPQAHALGARLIYQADMHRIATGAGNAW